MGCCIKYIKGIFCDKDDEIEGNNTKIDNHQEIMPKDINLTITSDENNNSSLNNKGIKIIPYRNRNNYLINNGKKNIEMPYINEKNEINNQKLISDENMQLLEKRKKELDKKEYLIEVKEKEITKKLDEREKKLDEREKAINIREENLNNREKKEKSLIDEEDNDLIIEKGNDNLEQKANKRDEKLDLREKDLNIKTQNLEKREKELNLKLENLDNREKDINKKDEDLKINYEEFNIKCKEQENSIKEKTKELSDKEENLIKSENSLKQKKSELVKKDEELKVKQTKLEEEQSELKVKQSKLIEEQSKLEENRSELKANQSKLEEKKTKLDEEQSKLEEKKTKLEEEQSELKVKRTKLEEEQSELKEQKSKFEEEQSELIEQKSQLEQKQSELKENQSKLEERQTLLTINENRFTQEKLLQEKKFKQKEETLNKFKFSLDQEKKDFEEQKEKEILLKLPNLVGLQNIGATCYMNATLQALSNTNLLTEYFLNKSKFDPNSSNKKMAKEYYKVLTNLWSDTKKDGDYAPYDFKQALSEENPLFAGIQANDSKDLINFLLERFHHELNNPKPNNNDNNIFNVNQMDEMQTLKAFITDYFNSNQSIITDCFYGILETKSKCGGCQCFKFNFQIYSFLEFPLEQVNIYMYQMGKRFNMMNQGQKNPDIDLLECFDYYQKIDIMNGQNQMYCNFCNANMDTYYGTTIYSLPNYLIINLNRGKGAVYECNVNFPENLNLLNYVSFKQGKTYFQLYAVICHLGPSSMSGHFVAYCRHRKNNKWYKYNDSFVTECTKAQEYNEGMPYILFYRAV